MNELYVSIGTVKRDISSLVNRVSYGGQRVVLTSHGKPKAVIVSTEDYEKLQQQSRSAALTAWSKWMSESEQLCKTMRRYRDEAERANTGVTPLDDLLSTTRDTHGDRVEWPDAVPAPSR